MHIFKRGWIILIVLFLSIHQFGICQSTDNNKNKIIINNSRPDIPGEIGFDLGLTIAPDFPDSMKLSLVHCTYFSPYYKYEFFIPNSNFSFITGLSLGLEKYRFKSHVTLIRNFSDNDYENQIVNLDTVLTTNKIKSSKLAVNYLEIPLELRFRSSRTYPKNSFVVSVGGKIGYMFNAHTKYKYRQEGQTKTQKQRDKFDLSPFRYGLTGRIGVGNFTVFYYYSLNTLFQANKGPAGNTSHPMMAGISFTLF